MNAKEIAEDVRRWFSNAVGDMAFEMVDCNNKIKEWIDPTIRKKLEKAKNDGVTDLCGWLADELYNDIDYCDMVGDRIYDLCNQNKIKRVDVYRELSKIGHTVIQKYCEKQIKYYEKNPSYDTVTA